MIDLKKKAVKLVKAEGIRQRSEGSFEVDFRVGGQRFQRTIKAKGIGEAKKERAKLIAEILKGSPSQDPQEREATSFESIWPVLERNIIADGLTRKTQLGLQRVYNRLFVTFRLAKYPHIISPEQLTLPFFLEYKSYYGVELARPKGLRSETQRLKIIMGKMRKLRFVSEELMRDLKEVKTPERRKKAYPEINATAMKALMAHIKADRPDMYGPIYFMLRTGRRVEETTLIERKDIIWDGFNPIRINIRAETTKMDTAAPLHYLDPDLQAHIRFYYQISNKHQDPCLFINTWSQRCKPNAITEYLGDMSQEVLKDIPGNIRITAHYLRHRFCTETCKAKLPLVDIQAISGIKDIATLIGNYCHSSVEGQASVLEKTKL